MRFAALCIASTTIILASCASCTNDKPIDKGGEQPAVTVSVPTFDANSAYAFVEKQVKFGPRIPGTPAHAACAKWLQDTLKGLGAEVMLQEGPVSTYTGKTLTLKNIIASYNPQATQRVLLCAHWDTRPFSDEDPDAAKKEKTFDGADDGGSGVGVLLEIGRCLKSQLPKDLGVDIVLFDVEDWGDSRDDKPSEQTLKTWCLGSQYWSKNLHKPGYKAKWGILLDMVGAKEARFPQEGTSMRFNPGLVEDVWREAQNAGFGGYFQSAPAGDLIDDHVYVNEIAGIKTIDIINMPGNGQRTFGPHWHTQSDNMSVIGKGTLKAVGQTVLTVIYKEAAGVL